MSKGRKVPAQAAPPLRTQAEQEHTARQAALLSLDPAQIRAWATQWGVPLIASSDALLIESAHAAIMRDATIPILSRLLSARVLADQGDPVATAMLAELERRAVEGANDAAGT